MRALVLEDNAYMRRLLTEVLREIGVQTQGCASINEARHELIARDFDFALVDIGIPPENGLDFIRQVRADRKARQRQLPMLVLSGQSQRAMIQAARDAGANDFLIKPVSIGALQTRLNRVLRSPEAFIESEDYYGPDRRRSNNEFYTGIERRSVRDFLI